MDLDFEPTVILHEHRRTRRVRAGAPAPDLSTAAVPAIATAPTPAPRPAQTTSLFTVLAVFIVGLLIALPSLAWLIRYLVRS